VAFTIVFYAVAVAALAASLVTDRKRTAAALKKSWGSFLGILPQFVAVIVVAGMLLAVLDAETISRLAGARSGWLGVVAAALVGAITLIPGFIAFPLAALLLKSGAGIMQIGAFVSSLMMVGVVTLPLETATFGKKLALVRNLAAFAFSFLVAFVLSLVVH
jgi:uncharacterized membrane protein YraQ (UPF0718 family)